MIDNLKNALLSIWSNKVRSVLTVLGVVIGVASVTTLVSLGEGLKKDVSTSIQGFGTNVITVVSGKLDTTNPGQSNGANPANFISGDILTTEDIDTIAAIDGIEAVSPTSLVVGNLKYDDKTSFPTIIGTYPSILDAMAILELDEGSVFTTKNAGNQIVLSQNSKKDLFGDESAIGKKITLGKDEEFEVVGTLAKSKTVGIFGTEFDSLSLIPFDTATRLNKDQTNINRIVAKANDNADIDAIKSEMKTKITDNHDGEEDFSVLTQDDLLGLFDQFVTLATTMVSAIAAISLVVGGIGIMNIMLVTVTERTREIGLRKAVGATKMAILLQFLIEAIMVTFVGALIGLGISFLTGYIIAQQTELTPSITPTIIGIAVGISVAIGLIFGLWPALRAANKDPIEALRYE